MRVGRIGKKNRRECSDKLHYQYEDIQGNLRRLTSVEPPFIVDERYWSGFLLYAGQS